MRQLPIRFKITLWFTAALLVMFLSSYLLVRYLGHQGLQKNIRDNLVEPVEHNVDEVEFYTNMDNIHLYTTAAYCSV